ncbi:MAG: NnrS family protein, partial [Hyphomicrobiales bacterium]|nr:NnrS family protein [Hyphomicrobiales bacterium]
GLHLAFMGGLGLGVLAVFALAGLLHTGQSLGLDRSTRLALLLLPLAVLLRVAPDFGFPVPGPMHLLAALIWPAAFLIWLRRYWPLLSDPATIERKLC